MDDSLRLIQHLYGDDLDDPTFARRVAEDDELSREYERLRDLKAALDRRSSPSPDPEVVDEVVAYARDAAAESTSDAPPDPTAPPSRAPDRTARAPDRTWTRRLRHASAVLALLLVAGLGWWQLQSNSPAAQEDTATGPSAQQSATANEAQEQNAESMPEWDDREEVVRLHRRVEQLRTRSRTDAWEGGDLQTVEQNP